MSTSVLKLTPKVLDNKALKRQRKQIIRIIKHLRDQLPPHKHHTPPISDSLIEQLVNYALNDVEIAHHDWHKIIYETLQILIMKMGTQHHSEYKYYIRAASPNHEPHLTPWQIKAFALRLLHEIDVGTTYFKE